MKTKLTALTITALCSTAAFSADSVVWKVIGQRDDFSIEWASNLVQRGEHVVTTMMRFKYAREDTAPNNRRFDNERFGLQIRCSEGQYLVIGGSYHMGDRQVDEIPRAALPEPAPTKGSQVQAIADAVCANR